MKKRALIIGNAKCNRNSTFLEGVNVDIEAWKKFLISPAGGYWSEKEIIIIENKKAIDALTEVKKTTSEYVLTILLGHGRIETYSSTDTISFIDEDIPMRKLVAESKKQTMIIDVNRVETNAFHSTVFRHDFAKQPMQNTPSLLQQEFEKEMQHTPEGILLLYANQSNRPSFENKVLGGLFTQSLLTASYNWAMNNAGILHLDLAFDLAKKSIQREGLLEIQEPVMAGQTRRLTFPPFAMGLMTP